MDMVRYELCEVVGDRDDWFVEVFVCHIGCVFQVLCVGYVAFMGVGV